MVYSFDQKSNYLGNNFIVQNQKKMLKVSSSIRIFVGIAKSNNSIIKFSSSFIFHISLTLAYMLSKDRFRALGGVMSADPI